MMLNLIVLVLWASVVESQGCLAFVCGSLSSIWLCKLQCWVKPGPFASQALWQPRAQLTADIGQRALAREIPPLLFIPLGSTKLPRKLRNR